MLTITVDFPDALIDIDRKITIKGAEPHTEVVVSTLTERANYLWRSEQHLQSDEQGQVQCGLELIYQQRPDREDAKRLFPYSVHHALHTQLFAQNGALKSDEKKPTVITQQLTHQSVQRVDIDEAGVKGVLFVPASAEAAPAVLLLKRQLDGPVDEAQAALYAARGYIAFAMDYDEKPSLDAFVAALDWLRQTLRPKHHFVAVSGYEEGAELALELGVNLSSQVSAVIACEPIAEVPSGGVHPLAIETLQAPLLLASGRDHSSSAYQESIAKRLQQTGFDYNFQWYDFEGVDAGLRFAHIPTTPQAQNAAQVEALAEANKVLWFNIIGFLHQAVAEAADGYTP